jgi:hypothetical protein
VSQEKRLGASVLLPSSKPVSYQGNEAGRMIDTPNTKPRRRPFIGAVILVSVLILSLSSYGAWQYLARRFSVPPPPSAQAKPRYAVAVLRADPQPKPSESQKQTAAPQPPPRSNEVPSEAEYKMREECYLHAQRQIAQKTAAKLTGEFPGLEEILTSEDPRPYIKAIPALLQRFLDATKTATPEHKPTLLLATDFIAARLDLPMGNPPSAEVQRRLNELAAQGLTYRWAELDGEWAYQSDMLLRLWHDYPSTEEGEDAFVLLLNKGFDTTRCCGQGSDNFRTVVREGEKFLSERPQSLVRIEVAFLLAQAYETWWSLSLTPEQNQEEGDPSPAAYREGAAAAREKAIAYYEEVLKAAPEGPQAQCSRQPLEKLQANQDTHQRRFYCYCD